MILYSYNSETDKPVRAIKPGDPDFVIQGTVSMSPRAAIEISDKCPPEYVYIIQRCYEEGWIVPVARVKDAELMWDRLGE